MSIEIEKNAQRGARKKIKVTFPDGTVICYKKGTDTFLEVLKKFDPELLATVGLEIGHLPMFSKTIYPGMASYMKPLKDGWYVNTRNDSADKYIDIPADSRPPIPVILG